MMLENRIFKTSTLLSPYGNLDSEQPDVDPVVSSEGPDHVGGRRHPLELDADVIKLPPLGHLVHTRLEGATLTSSI